MGLFDLLAKQAIGSVFGGGQKPADMLSSLLNEAGGLPGLMQKFQEAGLQDKFASWVSTGPNESVQPDQLEAAFGAGQIADLAKKVGIDSGTLLPLLSQFLPQIIDKLTPDGVVDNPHPSTDQLQSVISSVMKGGLGGLFGGRS
ncbi:YidB family protein [Brevifollis gellanilyticus]|uniref:DUF937 domain-containing protein n=1 Tax=Brevifollis gellanilyticus TaxID=748831 RepID=A0A512MB05_9BACT|nr:YidB family protein [Brevifollis gellanilyticus]GEP43917.1 hypothetical protein BGE01nite_32080 [Brevifollis gellanilyticus]